jgi:mannosyltransferase OCH1-like enzyme
MCEFFEIPKKITSTANNPTRKIPYIIHQTFKTNIVPLSMYNASQSYINKNKNYTYMFYDDNDILTILNNYDCADLNFKRSDLLNAYNSLSSGAGKADLFRYAIIYRYGGCYFDIDTVCLNPLDTFISNADEFVSGLGSRHDLHQWGMIYMKQHDFVKKALETCIYNIINKRYLNGYNTLEGISGPPCLDMAIKDLLHLKSDYKFIKGKYYVNNYKFTILNGDFFGNNILFKYSEYDNDLRKMKMVHWNTSGEIFK